MMKKLILIPLLLLLLLVGGALFSVDVLAKTGVEKGGTYALGVDTTLGSADIGVFSGSFGLSSLSIANPEGFEEDLFLEMDEAEMQVSMGSLLSDRVEVPLFRLDGITVSIEKRGGESNYGVLLENLEKLSAGKEAEGETEEEAPPEEPGSGKEFVIERIVIRNVEAKVSYAAAGASLVNTTVEVPEIEVDGSEGLTTAQLTSLIVRTILTAVVTSGEGVLPEGLTDELGDQLAGLGDLGKKISVEGLGAVEKIGKELGEGGEDLIEGVKDIFKKDED